MRAKSMLLSGTMLRGVAALLTGALFLPLLFLQAQDPQESTITQLLTKYRKDGVSDKLEVRRKSVEWFYDYARNLDSVVTSLMNRLTDPDAEIRNRAAMALGHLGSSAKLACPQLVKMLETEKEGSMRMRAASALGAVFFETYPDELDNIAIIALARALRADPSLLVRVQACASLKNIGPGAKDALGDLIDAMLKKEDDTTLSDAARDAFAWVAGPECKEHVPRLLEVYRKGERDTTMQFRILWALGKIGAHENEVVPLLVSALKDKDPGKKRLRAAGAVGLGEMRGKAKDAVPALIEALEESLKPDHDKSLNLRSSALEALRKIGPHAKAALPVLQKIANDSQYDRATRNSAALAVKSIEGSKK